MSIFSILSLMLRFTMMLIVVVGLFETPLESATDQMLGIVVLALLGIWTRLENLDIRR